MSAGTMEQSDFENCRRYLQGTPRQRAIALQGLATDPPADPRILALCEALLEDRTIALLSLPFSFGEIRWLAADAVVSIRRVLGISDPVVICDVFAPVSGAKAVELAKQAGIEKVAGIDGTIETLELLAKMDRLPRRKIVRTP